jgi:hypothetical protein
VEAVSVWHVVARKIKTTMAESRSSREYMREYMRQYRTKHPRGNKPFVGIDGEGGNVESGYHAYFLLRAGDRSLLPSGGNVRLTTEQCLDFISQLPTDRIYVGYFFDYDVTKILEDLGWTKLERLMDRGKRRRLTGNGVFPVDYRGFELDYLPRKEFKVRKAPSPWVVINDVGSFFQCRFVEALQKWGIGTETQRRNIGIGKEGRGSFQYSNIDEIAEYNALEIDLLQELMEKFRTACEKVGYVPARWQGPGLLAEAMFAKHGVKKTAQVPLLNDPKYTGLLEFGRKAYYGGRTEIMAVGSVERPVYQYDINSAYPYAMLSAPCLEHGEWRHSKHRLGVPLRPDVLSLVFGSFVAHPKTDQRRQPMWFGLPLRTREGTIVFPGNGRGWYWSFEARAAIHQDFFVEEEWEYVRTCDCSPLGYVEDIYAQRQAMGKDDAGTVLKLGLNSKYGKTVQSIGQPKYANPIWGSYFTAYCRAMIQDFQHSSKYCREEGRWCGKDILMVATDSLVTFDKRDDIQSSKELGGWSVEEHSRGMFIVQPGLYFGSSGKPTKTRGVPRSVIDEKEREFRDAFRNMVRSHDLRDGDVSVPQTMFVGIRYALHRHNLKLLGQWIEFKDPETGATGKTIKFDWRSKRRAWPVLTPDPALHSYIETFPLQGNPLMETIPYSKDIGGLALREELRKIFEDQPDWVPQIEPGILGLDNS